MCSICPVYGGSAIYQAIKAGWWAGPELGGLVNKPERRKVSLAGLGLISAGAVLGLALAGPGTARDDGSAEGPGTSASVEPPEAPQADS
jgi:hypothetical protein